MKELSTSEVISIFKQQLQLMLKTPKRYLYLFFSSLLVVAPLVFIGLSVLKNNYFTAAAVAIAMTLMQYGQIGVLKQINEKNITPRFADYFAGFKKINPTLFCLALIQMFISLMDTLISSGFKNAVAEASIFVTVLGPVLFALFWGLIFGWMIFAIYLASQKKYSLGSCIKIAIDAYFKNLYYVLLAGLLGLILTLPHLLLTIVYVSSISTLMTMGMAALMTAMWSFVAVTYISAYLTSAIQLVLANKTADVIYAESAITAEMKTVP